MLSDHEEQQLLEQVHQQPDAFRQLYRAYFPRVFAYVAYRVGSKQDSEDLVADIFLKVLENINGFDYRGAGSFRAWLFRIAQNHVNQFYRNRNKAQLIPLDDLPTMSDNSLSMDKQLVSKEQFQHLRSLIENLSPRRQEIIRLRYFAGLRNQDIAQLIGIHEKSVASHLSRALDDLQQYYEQSGEKSHE